MWLWKWVIGNLNPYTGSAKSYFQSVTLTAEAKNCEKNKPWIFTFLSITSSPQKTTECWNLMAGWNSQSAGRYFYLGTICCEQTASINVKAVSIGSVTQTSEREERTVSLSRSLGQRSGLREQKEPCNCNPVYKQIIIITAKPLSGANPCSKRQWNVLIQRLPRVVMHADRDNVGD